MAKRKKKVDLAKYEHLFDGTWMLGEQKIKRLEEFLIIAKDLKISIPKLKNELKEKENELKEKLKYLEPKSKSKKVKKNEKSSN